MKPTETSEARDDRDLASPEPRQTLSAALPEPRVARSILVTSLVLSATLGLLVAILGVEPASRDLRTLLFGLALVVVPSMEWALARWLLRRHPRSPWATGLLLILSGTMGALIAAEIVFTHFAQSDTGGQSLAGRVWIEKHWKPINRHGYRDHNYTLVDEEPRRKLVVLGDSIGAGWGIDDVENRFSNLLGQKLGEDYLVYNLSMPSASTEDELKRLKWFPHPADAWILCYFMNDIEKVAMKMGLQFPTAPKRDPSRFTTFLIERSYLLNYFFRIDWSEGTNYYDLIDQAFSDETIVAAHKKHLQQIIRRTEKASAPLIVVLFPFIDDFERNRRCYPMLRSFFRDQGIPIVDVWERIKDKSPQELVVNPRDAHPNEGVHRLVAEELHEILLQREIVPYGAR